MDKACGLLSPLPPPNPLHAHTVLSGEEATHAATAAAGGSAPSMVEGTVHVPSGQPQAAYKAALATEDQAWADVERRVVRGPRGCMGLRVGWLSEGGLSGSKSKCTLN
jgi:hypothetical protein